MKRKIIGSVRVVVEVTPIPNCKIYRHLGGYEELASVGCDPSVFDRDFFKAALLNNAFVLVDGLHGDVNVGDILHVI